MPVCIVETDILGSWQNPNNSSLIHQVRTIISPGRCGSCPARWSPMTFRYSQPCVAFSHTVSGFVCFTNRISLPKLGYKRNCGSCLLRSLVSLEGVWCHVMRKPKQLMERLKWQRTEASWHSHGVSHYGNWPCWFPECMTTLSKNHLNSWPKKSVLNAGCTSNFTFQSTCDPGSDSKHSGKNLG